MDLLLDLLVLVVVILVTLPSLLQCGRDFPKPEEVTKEVYCAGCEYTVKGLDKLLKKPSSEPLDSKVAEVLQSVCVKKTFENAEIPSSKLIKACEFLVEKHEADLEPLLVSHYSRPAQLTYLDLIQQVCQHVTKACVGKPPANKEHFGSGLDFDRDTQTFHVKDGGNVRMPQPVHAGKEEL